MEDIAGDKPVEDTESDLVDISDKSGDDKRYENRMQELQVKATEAEVNLANAEKERIDQQKRHRSWFFYWALAVITLALSGNFALYLWHMHATQGEPEPAIVIAWLSTTLVEVLGLGYIIAHSLFNSEAGSKINGRSTNAKSHS
jgi:hypothetical protein